MGLISVPVKQGQLNLVERRTTTANSTSLTFTVPRGAKRAKIKYTVIQNTGISFLKLQPNGVDTNCDCTISTNYGLGPATDSGRAAALLVSSPADANTVLASGECNIEIATGTRRSFDAKGTSFDSATPRTERRMRSGGTYNDSTTVISTLVFAATDANAILTGSTFDFWVEY